MKSYFFVLLSVLFFCTAIGWAEDEQQISPVVIRTSSAEYDEKTGKITAQISTIEWQGVIVHCPFLEVDTTTQEARSHGDISITWEDLQAKTQDLFYRRSDNVLLLGDVSGGNKELSFAAQKMEFDLAQKAIRFLGTPFLQTQDLVLRAERVAYLLQNGVWQAHCVNFERGEWKGKATEAQYAPAENLLFLQGEAQVWKGGNILRGERIRVHLDTGQIKIEGDVEINILP
ncbi:MAG: LptA/OstA family protein [Candidatus Caldatribacteriaceae bacterium]